MQIVAVKDNSQVKFKEVCSENRVTAFNDLQNIANFTISDLVGRNSRLLVFPHCLGAVRDKFGDSPICELCGSAENEKLFESATIKTGNIMGYVGCGSTELRIHSRFAELDSSDYFLHYMLQKVFSINVFDFKVAKDDESVFDFLLYLFPHYLKRALSQGVYKEYQKREYNDDRVRGPIDVSRHIRYNVPFNGKVAYRTREYVTDNRITELVRHTIEYIATTKASRILSNDRETRENVTKIRAATPLYNSRERLQIVSQNLKPIRNPYFSEYTMLQRLCVNILNHKKLKYGQKNDEIYGILFDGAWLWEEYLWTVLRHKGFVHPENKTGQGRWYLFKDHSYSRYPDFYGSGIVLDAKYKPQNNISRDDIHQLISYIHVSDESTAGIKPKGRFIYPSDGTDGSSDLNSKELKGLGGEIAWIGFVIPKGVECENYDPFCEQMNERERNVLDLLSKKENL